MSRADAVLFDLGGVLIDWNPRYLFRKLFADEAAMEHFLAEVCGTIWNIELDAGRSFDDGLAEALARAPEHADMIHAYRDRWAEMLAGPIDGTVAILEALHAAGVPLYALTNWSAETFPIALAKYPFLALFRGIVVSGEERLVKPDPRIFHRTVQRYRLDPRRTVFIDDSLPNVTAAAHYLGMPALRFTGPDQLRADLAALGFAPG
ncbi:MAG: HAD family phosphatase [Alphaproteobacteria bacterium]